MPEITITKPRPLRIYVASSCRNAEQPEVVATLAAVGFDVYDFRNPAPGDHGFAWSAIDPSWQKWDPTTFRSGLRHPIAQQGFEKDMSALRTCDVCLLLCPCGRSAHLELGFAAGAQKRTVVLLAPGEPELMLLAADKLCLSLGEVIETLVKWKEEKEEETCQKVIRTLVKWAEETSHDL